MAAAARVRLTIVKCLRTMVKCLRERVRGATISPMARRQSFHACGGRVPDVVLSGADRGFPPRSVAAASAYAKPCDWVVKGRLR